MTLEERFGQLSQYRRDHIARVMDVMEALANAHGLALEDACLAGWGHDLARELARPDLKAQAQYLKIPIGLEEAAEPVLLHGPIAAQWLKRAGRGNESVWTAIRFHTTAAAGLDSLGQALFIADGVEPGRQYPERAALFELSLRDLKAGYCAVLDQTRRYLLWRALPLHPDMHKALAECADHVTAT